jgi:ATP-dependent Clp protease ATP-binding subunit ClpC
MLALLRSTESRAGEMLRGRGVEADEFRARLLERVGAGDCEPVVGRRQPFTPRAKKVLEFSLREALALGTSEIATEHMLLAIAGEREHFAIQLLIEGWGLSPEEVRGAVIESLPSLELIPTDRAAPVPGVRPSPRTDTGE